MTSTRASTAATSCSVTSPVTSASSLPDVGEKPNQPSRFPFPKREFGKKTIVKRAFQQQWFHHWPWIHYDEVNDVAFCHTCVTAVRSKKLKNVSNNGNLTFIHRGYANWKDASGKTGAFCKHESSSLHKQAVEVIYTLPRTTLDVGELLSAVHASEKESNRKYLLKVSQTVKYLARQGLALRGDGNEIDSNFSQLLLLRANDDPKIHEYLAKRTDKYNSPQIQNELIQIMANSIVRKIAGAIKDARYYSLMADEVTDSSNREQVAICLRWIDEKFNAHEDFIGLHKVESIQANSLVAVLKDILLRLNLSLANCRGQCYDGAANMAGIRTGVATQISECEQRAIFTHCYGHALNLAAADTMRQSKVLCNALDTVGEISRLLKYSPRRDSLFESIKSDVSPGLPGFRTLCPTRWTTKAASLQSVIDNYVVFQELWVEAKDVTTDSEARARINGVEAQMMQFDFLFGLVLGVYILSHTDNLSKTLQTSKLSAADGQNIAELTCKGYVLMTPLNSFGKRY